MSNKIIFILFIVGILTGSRNASSVGFGEDPAVNALGHIASAFSTYHSTYADATNTLNSASSNLIVPQSSLATYVDPGSVSRSGTRPSRGSTNNGGTSSNDLLYGSSGRQINDYDQGRVDEVLSDSSVWNEYWDLRKDIRASEKKMMQEQLVWSGLALAFKFGCEYMYEKEQKEQTLEALEAQKAYASLLLDKRLRELKEDVGADEFEEFKGLDAHFETN